MPTHEPTITDNIGAGFRNDAAHAILKRISQFSGVDLTLDMRVQHLLAVKDFIRSGLFSCDVEHLPSTPLSINRMDRVVIKFLIDRMVVRLGNENMKAGTPFEKAGIVKLTDDNWSVRPGETIAYTARSCPHIAASLEAIRTMTLEDWQFVKIEWSKLLIIGGIEWRMEKGIKRLASVEEIWPVEWGHRQLLSIVKKRVNDVLGISPRTLNEWSKKWKREDCKGGSKSFYVNRREVLPRLSPYLKSEP